MLTDVIEHGLQIYRAISVMDSILGGCQTGTLLPRITGNRDLVSYFCVAGAIVAALLFIRSRLLGSPGEPLSSKHGPRNSRELPSKPSRQPGTWEPSLYRFPRPSPYPDWSIQTTKPLPYRPFRYGPKYFVTMGLRNIKVEDWIELDSLYPCFYEEKRRRMQTRGHKCCQTAPEAYAAAVELLQELADYLPSRYPSLYERTEAGIKNLWSGEQVDISSRPLPEDPMASCGRLTQDDLAIMIEKPDGKYYLLAGSILLAGFWRLEDKLGMQLSKIHTSGNVPHYQEKLEKGMDNLFRRLKPGEMVARNNYVVQVDDELAWSSASIGAEDGTERGWHLAKDDPPIEKINLRVERQTLHRLPRTGGVVFTIRTYQLPITELARHDHVPGKLASAVRSWTEQVGVYKGAYKYRDVLLKYLDDAHDEQIRRGLVEHGEDHKSAYPW